MNPFSMMSNAATNAAATQAQQANDATTREQLMNQVITTQQKAEVSQANAKSEIANMVRL
ncbi:hypothetical protein [Roseateles sp.]|jgi:hypothetical protein|uniref:hypothetical protein n=1 Tax=Roseateles sp. TaxID=1971397 RepID=UPI0031D80C6A